MVARPAGAGSRDAIGRGGGWKGFLAAVVAVLVATGLRWALDPYLGDELPFVTYFLAIVVAAWYGRLWPGVLATALSVLAAHWLFVSPRRSLAASGVQPQDVVEFSVFVLVGLALAGLSEALHRGRIEAQARARESAAATAAARAQKEVLRVTIASIGDAVVTTDSEARVTSMNAAAEALTGWKASGAVGRPVDEVLELADEASKMRILDPCGRAIEGGSAVGLPNRTVLISREGTELPIEDSAAPIRDETGKTLGCVLVFRDVTEQRRVQESLEHLAAIVSHSGDAIVAKRLDGTITSWNVAAERLYGLSAGEAIGRPISSIVPDDRSEELSLIMERLRRGEDIDRLETVRVRGDGARVDVSVTISPVRDPFGTVVGAAAITRDISERKRSEEALRRREQELADFFQNSVVGLHRLDADGVILDANQAELDMLGYARPDYVGRPMSEFHLDEQVIDDLLTDLRRGEPVRGREGRMRCADGSIKHVLIDANSYIENGEFKHSRGFTRDVTAEQKALEALRMSEERLRLAMAAGRIGVWDWDAVSDRLRWSDHVHSIHGQDPDAFGGTVEDVQRLVHPADADHVMEAFRMVRDGDSPLTTEFRILRPTGELRWVQTSVDVMRDDAGRPLRLVGATIDTTERKAAEQSARFLADASEAVTALDDPERAMRRLARACVPFFADWCTIHLTGEQGAENLVAYVHADPDKEPLVASLESERPFEWGPVSPGTEGDDGGGWYMRDAPPDLIESMAGDDRQLELLRLLEPRSWIAVPLKSRGKTLGSIAFVRSESGRRYDPGEKEVALEVVDRAATSVDNCMLYEELVKAGRQKDDFLAMLGHELRNPLAAIQYSVALAKTLPERAAWANDTIRRQVDHLARLVDDLLDVSRITRNVIELKKETIDVNDVVKRAVGTSRPAIDQQEHRLALRTPDPELLVSADPTRIEQVVVNLLTNAAKYTPKGGQITLSAFADGEDAVIRVEDSGIGIPPELLPHVFGLFTQAETELSRPQGGLGIGLTVVHRLIELHGGSVSAASGGVGQGSQFTVRLPLLEGARPWAEAPDEEPIRSGMRILVVDDNQDTADSVGMLLDSAGFATRVAYDGLAALEVAETFRPEVMLLDIGLPGLDGYQVAERLRGDPGANEIKLIAISGYGQGSDRQRSEAAGFDRHLVKPIDFVGLLDELKELAKEQP